MRKRKKKYYSSIKEYGTVKRPYIFYKIICSVIKLFFPKNQFIWQTEKPTENEPRIYVCNHTKIYAPTYFLIQHEEKNTRLWANGYFLRCKSCWQHLKTKVFQNRKPKFLLYPIGILLTPLIVYIFRAITPVPVYHKYPEIFTVTFKKSVETFNENIPQIIFPERTENKVNRYIYELNHGFPCVAKEYYDATGKKIKFYPVYCAEKLRTFVVGDPVEYNPEIPISKQKRDICHYLENKICELGDSLPEHEPVIYG